jgi:hypothetical protein
MARLVAAGVGMSRCKAIAWDAATGEFDREGTAENREYLGEVTKYEAPPRDDKGSLKWKASFIIPMLKLNGPQKAFLACVVDHANPKNGRADPSVGTIARETGYPLRTMERTVASFSRTPYLSWEQRSWKGKKTSNAYHVNWNALLLEFDAYQKRRKDDVS